MSDVAVDLVVNSRWYKLHCRRCRRSRNTTCALNREQGIFKEATRRFHKCHLCTTDIMVTNTNMYVRWKKNAFSGHTVKCACISDNSLWRFIQCLGNSELHVPLYIQICPSFTFAQARYLNIYKIANAWNIPQVSSSTSLIIQSAKDPGRKSCSFFSIILSNWLLKSLSSEKKKKKSVSQIMYSV